MMFFSIQLLLVIPLVAASGLPVVDLGYEHHQAIFYNSNLSYYNFSNIRYAQAPIGPKRFKAPVAPLIPASGILRVNDGSQGRMCPQGNGNWSGVSRAFLQTYTTEGYAAGYKSYEAAVAKVPAAAPIDKDPRITEDCLFLDVIAPTKGFANASGHHTQSGCDSEGKGKDSGLPVLVWLFGGGYSSGDKTEFDADGLIADGNSSFLFVAINYRLGALGWLAGPTFKAAGGLPNAGLHDQRLALEWVQQQIHKFGGDPNRVTVMGKSAGAGSIEHHITSYGGEGGPLPFQQALMSSPAFNPKKRNDTQEVLLQKFLMYANVSTLEQAMQLPSERLIDANANYVWHSEYGSTSSGPEVDGEYVPDLPGPLLQQGRFHHHVKNILVGHGEAEGLLFTSPDINSSATYDAYLRLTKPGIPDQEVASIENVLYPNPGNSTGLQYQRAMETVGDNLICNTYYINKAFQNQTYAWAFSVPPSYHGQDDPYIWLSPSSAANFTGNMTVAIAEQSYIASFVLNGVPTSPVSPQIPREGMGNLMMNLNVSGIEVKRDDTANERCEYWMKGLYTT